MNAALETLLAGRDLSEETAEQLLFEMPDLPPALTGALLVALRVKGETSAEIRGFARAMRKLARPVELPEHGDLVDVVGTGGDGSGSYNLSTGAALLAAACGARVVKHGNRSVSSRSGSADVLESLGLQLSATDGEILERLRNFNFTFLFAPDYHPVMKRLAPIRRDLGVRTIFNVLGPLTNPMKPPFHVIGAYDLDVARRMAEALSGLPIERGFVVHGAAGWDEPTPIGPFTLFDVTPGSVREELRDPGQYQMPRCEVTELRGGSAARNAAALRRVFDGEQGAHRDALVLGAALALEVTGLAARDSDGVEMARQALDDGRARKLLEGFGEPGRVTSPGESGGAP